MRYETNDDILKEEEYIREHFDDFPVNHFINEINTVSIDFVREAANYIDIKKMLWDARPWSTEETIEEHMNFWHSHLKEFWKDILTDKKFNNFYKPPKPVQQLKSLKQILNQIP